MPAGPETTTPQTGDPSAAIPVAAVSQGDDLVALLQTVLRQINVLPQPGDSAKTKGATGALKGTPSSVAVIESGATALSKGWAALIEALGGTTVIVGAVQKFWGGPIGRDSHRLSRILCRVHERHGHRHRHHREL